MAKAFEERTGKHSAAPSVRVEPAVYVGRSGGSGTLEVAAMTEGLALTLLANAPGLALGTLAGPGVVRGTARVIRALDEVERLSPGESLVTYATAPTWTPLFAIAAAVVTDTGGMLSHCAVVAREFGFNANLRDTTDAGGPKT